MAVVGTYRWEVDHDDPVAWWGLDTGLPCPDLSVNNNVLDAGSATLLAAGSGPTPDSRATDFTGVAGSDRNGPSATLLNPTAALTVECWVNPDTIATGSRRWISKEGQYVLRQQGAAIEGILWAGGSYFFLASAAVLTVGEWQHIAMTWDDTTDAWRLYRNGVQVASATRAGPLSTTTGRVYVGVHQSGVEFFDGKMAEVAIYSRALTATEIAAHHAIRNGRGLVANPVAVTVDTAGASSFLRKLAANTDLATTATAHLVRPNPITVPGLEGRHTYKGITFINDPETSPIFELSGIAGFRARPDQDSRDEPAGTRIGERPRPAQLRGKTVVYKGRLRARTLGELRRAETRLEEAFASTEIGRMDIELHPEQEIPDLRGNDQPMFLRARPIGIEGDEEQTSGRWERPFAISLRMLDPRFYVTEPETWATGPEGEPVQTVVAVNDGSIHTDPTITVRGPIGDPGGFEVANDTIGGTLIFDLELQAGEALTVDFRTGAITLDGADASNSLDLQASTWWDPGVPGLPTGPSKIRLEGAGTGPTTRAEITAHHAVL